MVVAEYDTKSKVLNTRQISQAHTIAVPMYYEFNSRADTD